MAQQKKSPSPGSAKRVIAADQIAMLTKGAAFLGSGGGGNPYIGGLVAHRAIEKYGLPQVIDVDDLADDAWAFSIAGLGATTVLIEKLINLGAAEQAFEKLGRYLGCQPSAIMPAEMGGLNSTIPLALGAKLGLPVIDADGMGRAFPEMQMVTFNAYGVSPTPLVISNEHLDCVLIETGDSKLAEDIGRDAATRLGLSAVVALYPMTGKDAKRTAIPGTLSIALGIGAAIIDGRRQGDPIEALLTYLRTTPYYNHCGAIFDGRITDLWRQTTSGFAVGYCVVTALDDPDRKLKIDFQNEFLVARENDVLRAVAPDLVCILDRETADPITTDSVRYGQRVKVVVASVAEMMRTPEALAVFGPDKLGINETYQPVETLLKALPA